MYSILSVISDCVIRKNSSTNQSGGLSGVVYVSNSVILDCEITNNNTGIGVGVLSIILNCLIANNGDGGVIGQDAYVVNTVVYGNTTNMEGTNFNCGYSAIEGGYEGDSIITLSADNPPLFVNPSLIAGVDDSTLNVDWHFLPGSPCINSGSNEVMGMLTDSLDLDGNPRVQDGRVDMGCYEFSSNNVPVTNNDSIIYVTVTGAGTHSGNSWENAMSSIDSAQALAQTHNAVVWVAAGVYYGDTTAANAFTMVEDVNVFGGFAGNEPANFNLSLRDFEENATILDGQNARRVLYQPFPFNKLTLWDGFTIQNGKTANDYDYGGGVYLRGTGSLCHCFIKNNSAYNGGGVYAYNGAVSKCLISNNMATYGGGVYAYHGTVSKCLISNNTASYGGGIYSSSSSIVSNCLISNNTATSYGGGVNNYYYSTITNSTIVRNMANNGAGIYGNSQGNLTNSIVWGNGTNELNNITGSITCSYSAVGGGFAGDGNIPLYDHIQQYPLFVHPSLTSGASDNTSNVDWHLQQGSVCINRGDNSVVTDSLDLDGAVRIRHDTVDMGCYESDFYSSPTVYLNYSNIIYVTQNGAGTQTGENWENATSSISFALAAARTYNADVWVASGIYYGDTTAESAFIMVDGVNVYGGFSGNEPADYDLSLRDLEANATILDGMSARRVLYQPSSFNTQTAWDGFTIRNGRTTGYGGGVSVSSNSVLSHCQITHNTAQYGGGVYANRAVINNCLITNNTASSSGWGEGGGMLVYNNTIICNSTIARNLCADIGGGVSGDFSSVMVNCIVWGNVSNNDYNNIYGDISCFYSAVEDGFPGSHNILLSNYNQQTPLFVNPSITAGATDFTENEDWHLLGGSPCINRGYNLSVTDSVDLSGSSRIKHDTVDMGCYESDYYSTPIFNNYSGIIYVTTTGSGTQTGESWDNATSSIAFASALARTYDADVWVAAGIYYGDTTTNSNRAFTMREGVSVYGGFEGNEPDDYNLSLRDFEAHPSILDGQNKRLVLGTYDFLPARALWDGFSIQNGWNTGISLDRNCTLNHCVVQNNNKWGIAVSSRGPISLNEVVVSNCKIVNNKGGGVYSMSGKTLIKNSLVTNNGTDGGLKGSFKVESTNILNNLGYGISGGTGNSLTNSIVWGNRTAEGTPSNLSGSVTCSYSAIEGGHSGDSIVTLSVENPPLFVNPSLAAGADDSTANVDWHLQQGSPCINRGDNSAVTDSLDLDGTARIKRDTVDVGCYESDYYCAPPTEYDSIIYVTVTGAGTHSGNSWENACPSIEVAQGLAQTHNAVVWVAAGTYYGDTTASNAFTMHNGVNVYGGFAGNEPADYDLSQRDFEVNATILDGQNARRVLFQPSSFNQQTSWDGFTIQNGQMSEYAGYGAGAYLQQNGRLSQCRIQNNIFTGSGGYGGGGVYCSSAIVENCDIIGNVSRMNGGGVYASYSTVSDCRVEGNSVTNSGSHGGGGVCLSHSTVRRCVIRNNTSANGYGSGGVFASYGTVEDCLVANNTTSGSGGGIYASTTVTITNSTIVRNSSLGDGAGVNASSSTLTNCIVWGNEQNGVSNNLSGSFSCTYSAVEDGCPGAGNIALNETTPPLFVSPSLTAGASDSTVNVDWHLLFGSPCINRGENSVVTDSLDLDGTVRIKRDTVDMGCYESDYYSEPMAEYDSIIYVTVAGAGTHTGESWANACSSIGEAQGLAQTHNAVVWVAAGTYYGDTTATNAFTMHNGVNVYGGFAGNEPADYDLSQRDFEANVTILDGQNARRVLYQPTSFSTQTTWNGFTIQNGQTTDNGGGAYLLYKGALDQCVVSRNTAYFGGGVHAENSAISNCIISQNAATGHYYYIGNYGGGGLHLHNTSVINSKIIGNTSQCYGGGICAIYSSVIGCQIIGNQSSNSGGGMYISSMQVRNCLVANNTSASQASGIGSSGSATVVNSTIVRNSGSTGVNSSSSLTLRNCIVWGNEQNGEPDNVRNIVTCTHSAVESGYPNDGNIVLTGTTPPLFVTPSLTAGISDSTANVDWHLLPGSPCINRGDNSAVIDSLDLDGTARVKRDTVDMGCYESDYYSVPLTEYDSIIYVTVTGAGTHSGNSWENATSSIDTAQTLARSYNADVWVAAGTYRGDTTANNAFTMLDGVNVYGGFAGNEPADYDLSLRDFAANATILDGMNARRVLYQPGWFNTETTWDGFTIQNGWTNGDGGGVYLSKRGRLSQCRVQHNTSNSGTKGGGGIWCEYAVVENCDILENKGYNGGGVYASSSTVSDCRVEGNSITNGFYGGGLYSRSSSINRCQITNNSASEGGGVDAVSSSISNCLISNNSANYGGGVYSISSTVVLCEISHNQSSYYGGGLNISTSTQVRNCLVDNNTSGASFSSYGGGGISGSGTIVNTTIVRNSSGGDGAGVNGNSSTTLRNCIVWGNRRNGTINNLYGNNIVCLHSAIEGGYGAESVTVLNESNPPLFVNPSLVAGSSDSTANVDWHLQDGSPCANRGDNAVVTDSLDLDGTARIKRDTVDLGCYESDYYSIPLAEYDSIIYVTVTGAGTHSGNSWENAISSIEDAHGLALTYNAVIWVAAGTYYGDTTASNAFTMLEGVNVYGGFAGDEPADYDLSLRDFVANETVLDGDSLRRVLYQPSSFNTHTTWDGFTIQNGQTSDNGGGAYLQINGALTHCKVKGCIAALGGGVYSSSGTLTSCDISGCAANDGGGLYSTASTISECIVSGCTAGNGGGVNCSGSTLSSCTITNNNATGNGGGFYSYNSNIVGCDIIGNESSGYGGGVYCYYNAGWSVFIVLPTKMIRCRIIGNHSYNSGGGLCLGFGDDIVNSCLVSNNTSNTTGGGVYGNGHLMNSTVVRNVSAGDGAGVVPGPYNSYYNNTLSLSNCIVWGNELNGTANNVVGAEVNYSAIEGGYGGTSNIMLDETNQPHFVNPSLTAGISDSTENVDWHLLQISVCINKGDNSVVTDSLDLDGTMRIKLDTVDLGCYESEYNSFPMTEYDSIIYVSETGSGTHTGNSWANAISSFASAQALAKTYNAKVWVASGTYFGDTTSANAFTMREGVNVYGGFAGNEPADYDLSLRDFEANATILDGQNARRVLYQPATFNTQTTWSGFTIQNGQTSGSGAGAYLQQKGYLSQCRIQNNISANGNGGGVFCNSAALEDCDIVGNKCRNNGGGVYASYSNVSDCRILNNSTTDNYGGGVYLNRDNNLERCKVIGNISNSYGGGVYTSSDWNTANISIDRCEIIHNKSSRHGGGMYISSNTVHVNNCFVGNNSQENTSSNYGGGGIYGSGTVTNTTIVRNTATGDGAGVNGSTSTTLQNCIVWGNERNGAVNNLNGSSIVCSHSAIEGGYVGTEMVLLEEGGNSPLFANPSLTAGADDSTANVDWHLMAGSPCINMGDNAVVTDSLDLDGTARIKHDTVDLGCYESNYNSMPITDVGNIIYVTQTGAGNQSGDSWANATASIEEAQALAQTYDAVVWVAAGTYYGDTTTLNAFTMRDGVNVYGGFAGDEPASFDLSQRNFETNATILDGQNERRVLNQPFEFNNEAIWSGFTIQNGRISGNGAGANLLRNGHLSQCKVQNNYSTNGSGGGIYCSNASVEGCVIVNNSCRKSGGGACALSSAVSDCRIENNTATNGGGGVSVDGSTVVNCQIVGNQSAGDGGGAWSYNTRFTYCDIFGNHSNNNGGGLYSYYSTYILNPRLQPTIMSYCQIANNQSANNGGGVRMGYYNDRMLNSLVVNNTSGSTGGGITGNGRIVNTTIVRNLSNGNGGGVTGGLTIQNCIVWGNKNAGVADNIYGNEVDCYYSAVEGGFLGEGNFILDESNNGAENSPYFVNPTIGSGVFYENGDWHLLPQSVCINVGNPDTTLLSETDLDGLPRLQQNRVDMGCYEYPDAAIEDSVLITVVSDNYMRGNATGSGVYNVGDTVLLQAFPNQYAHFLRWSDNDTTNPRIVVADYDSTFTAIFELELPELHVDSISHSDLIGGGTFSVSWTVRNEGTVPTPEGEVWYDRVWLSPEPKVDVTNGSPILLGSIPNASALAPGEYYTQTITADIPLQVSGEYYLFVITDAYEADQIFWENGVETTYNPPAYYGALSHDCGEPECGNIAGNKIFEISEYDNYHQHPYYHDNFFYELIWASIPQIPDLIVTSVFPVPQNFFSGSEVELTYQVLNDGDYVTGVSDWRDVVFVSYSPDFDSTAQVLKIIPHHGNLLPDSSYQVTTTVSVPLEMHGTAWFYVYTDYYDQVYEHLLRYNNVTRCDDSVNIILTAPADLAPQNIIADNVVSTGATFNFSYEIHNQGAGAPNQNSWTDICYLSTSANTLENPVQIASDMHFSGLEAGESYAVQHSIVLPNQISAGIYYLFVKADAENDVFEYTFEENNLVCFSQPISVLQPDLQVVTFTINDTLHAGAEEGISYRLANTGEGAIINKTSQDSLYLTQAPDGTGATRIAAWSHNLWMNAHDTVLKTHSVQLPSNLQTGVYYLFVETNKFNYLLNESDYNNNRSLIKRVYVHYQPLPDLIITGVELPDTVTAGDSVLMGIHLKNQGEVAANIGSLNWRLYATKGGHLYDCVVGSGSVDTSVIAPGESVYVQKNVFIAPTIFGNQVQFTMVVNANYGVTESIYSNNSHLFSQFVQPYPFDLAANQLASPNESVSGEYIPVSWTVENVGTEPSVTHLLYMRQDTTYQQSFGTQLPVPWFDKVYLSQDSLFDNTDVEIGSYTRNQTLLAGNSYTVNLNCQVPVAADGNYYVLVVSDATNATFDSHRANNVMAHPISVTQSDLPDLQLTSVAAPGILTTDMAYNLRFTVSNEGEHITHGDRWTDAVYLNNQPTMVDAVLLGSKTHFGQLDVSAQYSDSINVIIPNIWTGSCYLIVATDATDQIVEMNDESNNLLILPVSVARPLPCDLTVFPPDIPQSAIAGEDVQISWTVQNIGLNPAQGDIKEAVYLSSDSTWSSDDIMLGAVTYSVNLAVNGQAQRSASFPLQGVPIGDYYVVVKTNILNALNEDSYTNNKAVSLMTMHVDYPSLYIDQEEHRQLNPGQAAYYKLEVGPEYEHQTLSCKLTAPNQNVANGLYVAYSSAPTTTHFNWSATVPFKQEQLVLIPSLSQGIYYIMATGQTVDSSSQQVTILASIIDFEIISVDVNSGANTGSVTTQIIGAKFDTIMDFRLANSNGYLPAEKVFFHNSTETYATFNLRDQETGVYDMVAELPGGIITVKGQAFVVEQGLPAELLSNIIAPASVRNGNTFTVTIEYGNNGSTDLNISGFLLVSTNGFPIAFSSDSLANNATELTFETGEPNGNPDVIRPGYFATKTIFVKANRVGNINLKLYPIRRQY